MASGPEGHEDGGESDGSFEARLRAARSRHGLEGQDGSGSIPARAPDQGPSPLSIGMRVGVELVAAFVVAVAIGLGLDRWLHTGPVLLIVFVLLGGAAGLSNVWRLMGPKAPRR